MLTAFAQLDCSPLLCDLDGSFKDYSRVWLDRVAFYFRHLLSAALRSGGSAWSGKVVSSTDIITTLSLRSLTPEPSRPQPGMILLGPNAVVFVVTGPSPGLDDNVLALAFPAASVVPLPPRPLRCVRVLPQKRREIVFYERGSVQPALFQAQGILSLRRCSPHLSCVLVAPTDVIPDCPSFPDPSYSPWAPYVPSAGPPLPSPSVDSLNQTQQDILSRLSSCVEVIQGPPGSGKSTLIAAICHSCVKPGVRILLTAPSNKAVNSIAEKLLQWGVADVLAVGSRDRMGPSTMKCLLPNWVRDSAAVSSLSAALHATDLGYTELAFAEAGSSAVTDACVLPKPHHSAVDSHKRLRERLSSAWVHAALKCIQSVRVVLCTSSASIHVVDRLRRDCFGMEADSAAAACESLRFALAIQDEAGATLEPESLFALLHGAQAVLQVGDHHQLPPYSEWADVGYTTSLMERLYALSSVYGSEADHVLHCRMMDVQYRMPPVIGDAVSRLFYNGLLRSRVGLDLVAQPLRVCAVDGVEKRVGSSWANDAEASAVVSLASRLISIGELQAHQVCVITFYSAQRDRISALLTAQALSIAVATADSMQGSECEVVLLSAVRTDGVGFLSDRRRLNVALSRSRQLLVVFAQLRVLNSIQSGVHLLQSACSLPVEDAEIRQLALLNPPRVSGSVPTESIWSTAGPFSLYQDGCSFGALTDHDATLLSRWPLCYSACAAVQARAKTIDVDIISTDGAVRRACALVWFSCVAHPGRQRRLARGSTTSDDPIVDIRSAESSSPPSTLATLPVIRDHTGLHLLDVTGCNGGRGKGKGQGRGGRGSGGRSGIGRLEQQDQLRTDAPAPLVNSSVSSPACNPSDICRVPSATGANTGGVGPVESGASLCPAPTTALNQTDLHTPTCNRAAPCVIDESTPFCVASAPAGPVREPPTGFKGLLAGRHTDRGPIYGSSPGALSKHSPEIASPGDEASQPSTVNDSLQHGDDRMHSCTNYQPAVPDDSDPTDTVSI